MRWLRIGLEWKASRLAECANSDKVLEPRQEHIPVHCIAYANFICFLGTLDRPTHAPSLDRDISDSVPFRGQCHFPPRSPLCCHNRIGSEGPWGIAGSALSSIWACGTTERAESCGAQRGQPTKTTMPGKRLNDDDLLSGKTAFRDFHPLGAHC